MQLFENACNYFQYIFEVQDSVDNAITWTLAQTYENQFQEAMQSVINSIIAAQSIQKGQQLRLNNQTLDISQNLDEVMMSLSQALDLNFRVYAQQDGNYKCKWYSFNRNRPQIVVTIGLNQHNECFIPIHRLEKAQEDDPSQGAVNLEDLPFKCTGQNVSHNILPIPTRSPVNRQSQGEVQQHSQLQPSVDIQLFNKLIQETTIAFQNCHCQRVNQAELVMSITNLLTQSPELHPSLTALILSINSQPAVPSPTKSNSNTNQGQDQQHIPPQQSPTIQDQTLTDPIFCQIHNQSKDFTYSTCEQFHCSHCLLEKIIDQNGGIIKGAKCEHSKPIPPKISSQLYKIRFGVSLVAASYNQQGLSQAANVNQFSQSLQQEQVYGQVAQNYNPQLSQNQYYSSIQPPQYGNVPQTYMQNQYANVNPYQNQSLYAQSAVSMQYTAQAPQVLNQQAQMNQMSYNSLNYQPPANYATQYNANAPQHVVYNEPSATNQSQLVNQNAQQMMQGPPQTNNQNIAQPTQQATSFQNKPNVFRQLQACSICQTGKEKDEFGLIAHRCDVCNECRVKRYLQTGNNECPNPNCNTMYGDNDCDMLQIMPQIEPEKYGNIQRAPPQEQGELKYCSSCSSYKHQNVIRKCSNNRCQSCTACIQSKGRGCQCGGTFQQEVQASQQNQGGGANQAQLNAPPRPAQLPQAAGKCMKSGCKITGEKPGRELQCGHWIHFGCIDQGKCPLCKRDAI